MVSYYCYRYCRFFVTMIDDDDDGVGGDENDVHSSSKHSCGNPFLFRFLLFSCFFLLACLLAYGHRTTTTTMATTTMTTTATTRTTNATTITISISATIHYPYFYLSPLSLFASCVKAGGRSSNAGNAHALHWRYRNPCAICRSRAFSYTVQAPNKHMTINHWILSCL